MRCASLRVRIEGRLSGKKERALRHDTVHCTHTENKLGLVFGLQTPKGSSVSRDNHNPILHLRCSKASGPTLPSDQGRRTPSRQGKAPKPACGHSTYKVSRTSATFSSSEPCSSRSLPSSGPPHCRATHPNVVRVRAIMRTLAQVVHRSFRRVEHCADWMTGAAGPLFVGLCIVLVSIGMWTFCRWQQGVGLVVNA